MNDFLHDEKYIKGLMSSFFVSIPLLDNEEPYVQMESEGESFVIKVGENSLNPNVEKFINGFYTRFNLDLADVIDMGKRDQNKFISEEELNQIFSDEQIATHYIKGWLQVLMKDFASQHEKYEKLKRNSAKLFKIDIPQGVN